MTPYVTAWLIAFVITVVVETPVYMVLIGGDRRRAAFIGFTASVITHPVLWFVVQPNVHWTPTAWFITECMITVVEAGWMGVWAVHDRQWRRLLAIAFAANVASILMGELLRPFVPYL
ncbi:MAG: hypothetical protein ACJAYU_003814 [Bradymonadia bacterium]|jgi:hypothetical protein